MCAKSQKNVDSDYYFVLLNIKKRIKAYQNKTLSEEGVLSWWWTLGCRKGFPFPYYPTKNEDYPTIVARFSARISFAVSTIPEASNPHSAQSSFCSP